MSHHVQAARRSYYSFHSKRALSAKGILRVVLFAFVIIATSCKKNPVQPPVIPQPEESQTRKIDLGNRIIPFWGKIEIVDIDGDRFPELIFEIVPVGDALLQRDRWLWNVKTTGFTSLPIDLATEQVPLFSKGQLIDLHNFENCEWYPGVEITLFEKIISINNVWWEGNWLQATHNFLPFKVYRPEGYYLGWVEISVDTQAQQAYLHRAGISKDPNKPLKAGY